MTSTRRSVRGHEARFRALFHRLLVLSVGVPGTLQACAGNGAVVPSDAGGGDATLPRDSAADPPADDASNDSGTLDDASDASAGDDAPTDATTDVAPTLDAADSGDDDVVEAGRSFPGCNNATTGAPYTTEAGGACGYFLDFSCAPNAYAPVPGTCKPPVDVCLSICNLDAGGLFGCDYAFPACTPAGVWIADAGQAVTLECELCPGIGRRPAGLRKPGATKASSGLGAHFARASHLEAASVHAFERLARELSAHGAPSELVGAARRSAADEVRHARVTARIARRHGGKVAPPRVRPTAPRSLEQVARENVVEGCVRETFGAMVATWQAANAHDEEVRRCMTRIAIDETRHASLAWAIAEWASSKLDDRARARIARAEGAAVRRLERDLALLPGGDVARLAGLPTPSQSRALVRGMTRAVWPGDTR